MTAQLPPNLLKLFAPRPPLPYARPVGKSPNTIRPKTVNGVAALLAQIRDDTAFSIAERGKSARKTKREAAAKKEGENGDAVMANGDTKEEGEEDDDDVKVEVPLEDPTKEPGFSYAEETRRQIAREEKARRRKEAFENAKTTCEFKPRTNAIQSLYPYTFTNAYTFTSTDTPNDNKKARGDPYKTLFISRLVCFSDAVSVRLYADFWLFQSKKATEADVRKEFEIYGNIEYLTIVKDEKGRSRGYCFIVYEREKDMKGDTSSLFSDSTVLSNPFAECYIITFFTAAYKDAEGLVILGKKILVDVERGRTVRGWKPRRLGGGLGGRPKPVAPVEAAPAFGGSSFGRGGGGGGGGFRGGGRGGFSDRGGGGFRGRGGGFGDRGGFGGGDRGGGGGGFRGGTC